MNDIEKKLQELKMKNLKNFREGDLIFLEEQGIINGVGNNCLHPFIRWIMTQFFFYLDFRIHDARYWQIEDMPEKYREVERKKSDFGLLKYTWISPIRAIEKYRITGIIAKDIGWFLATVLGFCIRLIPCVFVAIPAYIAVRFGGKKSFKTNK